MLPYKDLGKGAGLSCAVCPPRATSAPFWLRPDAAPPSKAKRRPSRNPGASR